MRAIASTLALALSLAALPATGFADAMKQTVTAGNSLTEAPAEWLGETPHLVIMGDVAGYHFDVQYLDLATADVHAVEVKREYLAAADSLLYREFDTEVQAIVDGLARKIEFKLNHADFRALGTLPATLALSAAENPEGSAAYFEFEMEWEAEGTSVNEEIGTWDGRVVLALDDAFGNDAPVADGLGGGYITARHGDDTLVISYTFPVSEAEVDE